MHIGITVWVILASWRWGDWKNFNRYHSTMLYMSAMNLFYLFLTSKYPLWRMHPDLGLPFTLVTALYTFIIFPFTVLLYLSHFPDSPEKQILYTLKWIVIYIGVEWVGGLFSRITYDNGWHLGWSLIFVLTMFPMLRLHYKKPILTYMVSIFVIAFLVYLFDVPWQDLPANP
ncbi:hypothetical protein GCM10007063_33420 [Lentibacillus kapialis]|uniref:Uncharacterized protein n=1 Tax=Lentibacillus kapialis TaxID=340214 RepID=A0A917Q2C0_9BACI|nr:CBO0543 family protein [Lentibacillus kapialis]GGK08337.1 hypothetical protein GCM10007063_33420 [Lentibacillus kapialis]